MLINPLLEDPLKAESAKICDVFLNDGQKLEGWTYLPLPLPQAIHTKRFISQEKKMIEIKDSHVLKVVCREDADGVKHLKRDYMNDPEKFIKEYAIKDIVIAFLKENQSNPANIKFIHENISFNEIKEVKIKSITFHNREWNFEGKIVTVDNDSYDFAGFTAFQWFKILTHSSSDEWITKYTPKISSITITHP